MTIEEIKNQVAQEQGYKDWNNLLREFRNFDVTKKHFNQLVSNAMHRLAEIVAIKQREQIAEKLFMDCKSKVLADTLHKEVLSVALASDEYKP